MLALLAYLPAASREGMVRMYCAALKEQMALIGAALEQEPSQALGALHKISGAAGMMRDQAMSQAARATEEALESGDLELARTTRWPALQRCAEATLEGLAQRFPAAG